MRPFTSPGKVFLLGEYAALAAIPAILAAIEPRFELREVAGPSDATEFHPESPAGKLLAHGRRLGWRESRFKFVDPYRGAGGFGGSSAQFVLTYRMLAEELKWSLDWREVWKLYRWLTNDGTAVAPSGADVVAQWEGGLSLCNPGAGVCEPVSPAWDGSGVFVFSAASHPGRKAATHKHLKELSASGFPSKHGKLLEELELQIEYGISAIRKNEPCALGLAMEQYGDALATAGFEIEATGRDRKALRGLSGVLGVKGTGALQADAILVLFQGSPASRARLLENAHSRGLELVSEGLLAREGAKQS